MSELPSFVSPLPQKLVYGSGSIERLGELTADFGTSALVVIGGSSLARSGNLDRALARLQAAGVKHDVFSGVPAEPTLEWVDKGRQRCEEVGAEVIIGIGGGSVMDVAKAIGALAREAEPTAVYHRGEQKITQPGVPLIACPTTSGTGAEVTPNSVLTDPERGRKASLRGGDLMHRVALVDPVLTRSCPPQQTAYSGLDAIVQALESYVSTGANPYTDALALQALRLMAPSLERAVEDGEDLQAREAMALGSTMAGMALACARLGLVHGLAHPIGHLLHLPHGLVCGALMPTVMEFNLPVAGEKYATAAQALGLEGDDPAEALVEWFAELARRVGVEGLPGLEQLGEAELDSIVQEAMASGSTKHNPRSVREEHVRAMLALLRATG
ncbi:MAG: iron-containing alcohol dehydrogenase [Armatimonadetes bacterium]|nr:iron-containing alcohol dehydrogenase [Armatimonadota bacterium]